MFYLHEEFEFQVQELINAGYSRQLAEEIVRVREVQDEREYMEWRDEQDEIARQEEMYAEHNDNWYDEQYELDTDYL